MGKNELAHSGYKSDETKSKFPFKTPWLQESSNSFSRNDENLKNELLSAQLTISEIFDSNSWRVTAPLRNLKTLFFKKQPANYGQFARKTNELNVFDISKIISNVDIDDYQKNPDVMDWILNNNGYLRGKKIPNKVKYSREKLAYFHFVNAGIPEARFEQNNRRIRINLTDFSVDFDEEAYLNSNFDIDLRVKRGEFASGFDHFVLEGLQEILEGNRSIYNPDLVIQKLRTEQNPSAPKNDKLVIFAHFDEQQIVDVTVVKSLIAYVELGYEICFVTNVEINSELDKLHNICRTVIVKNNAGRDIGSWYLAFRHFTLDKLLTFENVLLTNDSVYFPVCNPAFAFRKAKDLGYELWGMTDTVNLGYHIQSYFLHLNQAAVLSIIPRFIDQYEKVPYMVRGGLIASFELEITKWAMESGLKVGAIFSVLDAREDAYSNSSLLPWKNELTLSIGNTNPSHHLWDLLISGYKVPTLKHDLLWSNPTNQDLSGWRNFVEPDWFDHAEISNHLMRKSKALFSRSENQFAKIHEISEVETAQLIRRIVFRKPDFEKKLVLFSHYDPEGIIDNHVLFTLGSLNESGCDVIFITATDNDEEFEKINHFVSEIIVKNNAGRDFGSYQLALKTLGLQAKNYAELIWANDSQYFPLFSLNTVFEELNSRKLDYWGLVDNHTETYHLMTFFVGFSKHVLDAGFVEWFLEDYKDSPRKFDIIRNGEMRVATWMINNGFSIGAYTECAAVSKELEKAGVFTHPVGFNMNIDYWKFTVEKMKSPLLKCELILKNPTGQNLKNLAEFVSRYTDYQYDLIDSHRKRMVSLKMSQLRLAD